jgi:hypothetical protein
MPITDGQLFISNAGEALDPTHLVEIQRGTSPFSVAGTTEAIQRPLVRAFIDRQAAHAPLTRHYAINITTELKGTDGTPSSSVLPEINRLLKASGLSQTLDSSTHVYEWLADPSSSTEAFEVDCRFEELIDGNYYVAEDTNFTFTMQGSADAVATATFSGMGSYAAPADVSSLTSATANGGSPLLPITSYSIAGKASGLVIRSWSVSSGLTLTPRVDLANSNGYTFPPILSRDAACTVSLELEAVDASTLDYFDLYVAATASDVSFTLGDGTREILFELLNVAFNAPTISQGAPNMVTLAGSAANNAAGTDSSLTITYT